ncbi:MAG: F0F1 ATP synthase subunit delta [Terrimicrobiaceae bacterium]
MKISRESRKLARDLFRLATENGKLDASRVSTIISTLTQSKPRGYFAALKELTRLVRLELAQRHATVVSATPLPQASADAITKSIHSKFGEDLTTEFLVSPGLIGGLRIQVGSDVWDGSVLARLAKLKSQI